MVDRKNILNLLLVSLITFLSMGTIVVPAQLKKDDPINLKLEPWVDNMMTGTVHNDSKSINYCLNISDDAAEARNTVLTTRLKELESQVDEKLDRMSKQIKVLKKWTNKREAFLKKANESLIQIFQSMRPDAAAQQFTEMGPGMSASIIAKLEPKYSSAILTEMKPADAAKIAMVLTNVLATDAKKTK